MNTATWRTASYTGDETNCVEVAIDSMIRVRDTKNRGGGQLTFSPEAWRAFVLSDRSSGLR